MCEERIDSQHISCLRHEEITVNDVATSKLEADSLQFVLLFSSSSRIELKGEADKKEKRIHAGTMASTYACVHFSPRSRETDTRAIHMA